MTDTVKHMWDQVEKARADGTFSSEHAAVPARPVPGPACRLDQHRLFSPTVIFLQEAQYMAVGIAPVPYGEDPVRKGRADISGDQGADGFVAGHELVLPRTLVDGAGQTEMDMTVHQRW